MKLFKPFNLIMYILIPIIMFFGFSLYSYGSELKHFTFGGSSSGTTFNGTVCTQNTSVSSASEDCWTFIHSPVLQIRCTQTTAFTYPMSWEFHVVTTAGDFVCSTGTVSSLTASSWTQLITNKYVNNFLGAIQYVYVTCNYSRTNTTMITWSGNFDVELRDTENEIWNKTNNQRINETLTNTQLILDSLGGGSGFDYTTPTFTNCNLDTSVEDDYYYTILLNNSITFNTIPDFASISLVGVFQDGTDAVLKTFYFDNATLTDSPTQNIIVDNMSFSSKCMSTYLVTSCGGVDSPCFTFVPNNHLLLKNLNKVFDSWADISSSEQLNNLNNTTGSIGTIISDNGTFENSAFTNLSNNLDSFGFDDWSLVPISSELTTAKNIITMFYNILPFKIQWLFTSIMALGLIVMLLTVGTRVVQRTGDFTRAKPVKMNIKSSKKG